MVGGGEAGGREDKSLRNKIYIKNGTSGQRRTACLPSWIWHQCAAVQKDFFGCVWGVGGGAVFCAFLHHYCPFSLKYLTLVRLLQCVHRHCYSCHKIFSSSFLSSLLSFVPLRHNHGTCIQFMFMLSHACGKWEQHWSCFSQAFKAVLIVFSEVTVLVMVTVRLLKQHCGYSDHDQFCLKSLTVPRINIVTAMTMISCALKAWLWPGSVLWLQWPWSVLP